MYNNSTDLNKSLLSIDLIKADESPEASEIYKFSDLDIGTMSMYLRGTWIYNSMLDIEQLKSSLGKLLSFYPHLAGRITPDKTGVAHVNKGVPFIVREDWETSVNEIQKTEEWGNRFTIPLNFEDMKKGKIAPINFTITLLKDGTVLSVQCSHSFVDGGSFYGLIDEWGKLNRGEEITKPYIDQSLFEVEQSISKDEIKQTVMDMGWKKVTLGTAIKMLSMSKIGIFDIKTRPFYFSPESIERLKDKISLEGGFKCSSNIALSAFIGKMYMILNNLPHEEKYTEAVVVNLRNRFEGIPGNFFGNASTAIPTGEFDRSSSLSEIAKVIHDSLIPMLRGSSKNVTDFFRLNLAAMGAHLPYTSMDLNSINAKQPQSFYNNNFSKLPIYTVDFGTGEPVMVIPHNITNHQMLIWPVSSSVNDGVEVYFSGNFARLVNKLKEDDPWLLMMKKYEK